MKEYKLTIHMYLEAKNKQEARKLAQKIWLGKELNALGTNPKVLAMEANPVVFHSKWPRGY